MKPQKETYVLVQVYRKLLTLFCRLLSRPCRRVGRSIPHSAQPSHAHIICIVISVYGFHIVSSISVLHIEPIVFRDVHLFYRLKQRIFRVL